MVLQDRDRYAPGMKAQLARFHGALSQGMPRMGWKVGINVPEILAHLRLAHSGVGWLDGNHVFRDAAELSIPVGAELKLEPELAIHMGGAVEKDATDAVAVEQIRGVSPAFELVNYAQPKDGLDTIVGHSMFHFGCVLGEVQSLDAASEMGTRWPRLEVEGIECPAPRSDLVPENLGSIVGFVARYLGAFDERLEPGDIIMSGSYTATAIDLLSGTQVRADYGTLGSLSVRAE